jgi:sugar O-acyltransferase (sialic acid O-acetyltransferase NeuD family)
MKRIAVIGAGGFAREVAWLIRDLNRVTHQFEFLGFLVSDISLLRETDSRDEVLGDFNWLDGGDRADALVLGIGIPRTKLNLAAELDRCFPSLEWPTLIHPTVQFDRDSARFERGVVMCAGSVSTVNLKFEEFSMVNILCTIGHESRIGRGAVLNPTVNISGGVTIGEGVLVGTGAQVLQYIKVGENATVGAGSVVIKDVEAGATVFGIPARSIIKQRPTQLPVSEPQSTP